MKLKTDDLPGVEGPGVSIPKDKKLDKIGDTLYDLRESKSKLAEEITAEERKALDRMQELGIQSYRFGDKIMEIKLGSTHVKVKNVKAGDNGAGEEEE